MSIDWKRTVVCCPDNPSTKSKGNGCGETMHLVAVSSELNNAKVLIQDPQFLLPVDKLIGIWRCRCGKRWAEEIKETPQ